LQTLKIENLEEKREGNEIREKLDKISSTNLLKLSMKVHKTAEKSTHFHLAWIHNELFFVDM